MLFYPAIALALALGQVSAATNLTWSPCPPSTAQYENIADIKVAECTTYAAPLCHPGVCESPDADSTVDVFVWRIPAKTKRPEDAPNVWLVQGGPSYTDILLDIPIMMLYTELNTEVNVYTMDYRGAGQSALLKCEAQTKSDESDMTWVPACAKELEEKYGDLAAFSTTSAAKDMVSFISDYGNDFSTIMYGVGFSTMWVERVMHLDPPEVTGYVLDGVATTSGSSLADFYNIASADAAFDEVADAFMALCSEDKS